MPIDPEKARATVLSSSPLSSRIPLMNCLILRMCIVDPMHKHLLGIQQNMMSVWIDLRFIKPSNMKFKIKLIASLRLRIFVEFYNDRN